MSTVSIQRQVNALHADRYAARADSFHPSPVRAVFEVSMLPGMISLAGGNPDLSLLPLGEVAEFAREIVAERGLEALQYGSGAGTEGLTNTICEVMAAEGTTAVPENILVTSGSQMALELIATMFCDPGDVVLAEGPTYVGAIGTFEGLQAEISHIALDSDGLIPEQLEQRIRELRAAGKTIKLLYTIPNFNNPAGVSLSLERRQQIVDICRAEGIAIVEDNPYGLLSFSGQYLPSLHGLDPENVFYLGSFSKIFSPGVRVGWLVAPVEVRNRLQLAAEATTICPSVLSQLLVERYITEFDWKAQIRASSELYRERAAASMAALGRYMPVGTTWTVPEGGFFTWVTLPAGHTTDDLLQPAIDNGVVFVPGSAFYADGSGANNFRIAFSFESAERLTEGIRRLGKALTSR
ncbi:aminotransferase-like domain-containing protein [Lysinibacter cavernae]|uniref:DNA-binding transcriptional MocR family regulator n=1 Tax=Lysinibacter cavernae TaxID=1640652 RepID=A0A7X5R1T6_9MICO|nr:PLP-dependent aminotransferase family protein [Lysinibacter cavernae]NIH54093.1 DNA-binding transcriptional MocR family regulator [Lysinibacter cavernae]